MTLNEFSAEIAEKGDVTQAQARRTLKALFEVLNEKLDQDEDVVVPQFAKIVVRTTDSGEKRYVLRRRTP